MTNFERMMQCKTPEEFTYVYERLKQYVLYANGKLLNNNASDFLEWLNKEIDDVDIDIAWNNNPMKCPKCGASNPNIIRYDNEGNIVIINENDISDYYLYKCSKCSYIAFPENTRFPKTKIEALLVWNY